MHRLMAHALLAGCLTLSSVLSVSAHADFIEDFAKHQEVLSAKLAPDGQHIAVLREIDAQRVVLVYRFPAMTMTTSLSFPGEYEVGNFWWVNEERVLALITRDYTNLEEDRGTGELFGINADGTRAKHLFGYRAGGGDLPFGRIKRAENEYASGYLLHRLPELRKEVLIQIRNWDRGIDSIIESAYLNVYSGKVHRRFYAPVVNSDLYTDADGEIRFAYSTDDDQNSVVHLRNPDDNTW